MVYLSQFTFPSYDEEYAYRLDRVKRTCYNTMYPFFVLSAHGLERLDFQPITIFTAGTAAARRRRSMSLPSVSDFRATRSTTVLIFSAST